MRKWNILFVVVVLSYAAYAAWDYFRAGLHTRPTMPDGAFSLSFASGLRAILVDVPDQRDSRRYFGYPLEVPFYLEDAWSICSPPTEEEQPEATAFLEAQDFPGSRFEVVCRIQVDDETVIRGVIVTVPRL